MQISECKALVTGGSRGIGLAIARALKNGGAGVAITGRDTEALKDAAKETGAFGIVSDVRKEDDCKRAVEEASRELGGLNVLVNNAGIGYNAPLESIDADLFLDVWATNVLGPTFMAREALPIFKGQKGGTIVNIASTSALRGYETATAYVASKFALRGMSQCWQAELRRYNIRIIEINPSEVQTEFFGRGKPRRLNPKKLHAEDVAHTIVAALAMDDRGFIPELTIYATNPW